MCDPECWALYKSNEIKMKEVKTKTLRREYVARLNGFDHKCKFSSFSSFTRVSLGVSNGCNWQNKGESIKTERRNN